MSGQPGPSVAVVITTFNHARFLQSAIESALRQTVPPNEIIVVDDGSDDRPDDVTSLYPAVRLISQRNQGLAAARNTGLGAVASDYVLFLDADDRLLPDAIRLNLETFAKHPESGFVYGAYNNLDAATGQVTPVALRAPFGEAYGSFLRGNLIGMHATVMYCRDRLYMIGGFRAGLPACEDYDVYLRMARQFPIACRPEPLAEYWHHEANMSRDPALMLRAALLVLGYQHQRAGRSPALLAAYRHGVVGWKRYYAAKWLHGFQAAVRSRRLTPRLLRQGAALALRAPATLPAMAIHEAARMLRERLRAAPRPTPHGRWAVRNRER